MAALAPRFALNHMVCPHFSIERLMRLAVELGIDAVELRNDVGHNSLSSLPQARAAGELARELGLEVLSVNALYPFNHWNDQRAAEAETLAELAAMAGARGLVLCPLVDEGMAGATPTSTDAVAALVALDDILGRHGLEGFVEPLGFPISTLRFKQDAIAAMDVASDALGQASVGRFSLVHDTFHHRGADEAALYPSRTGLVHLSGVEDPALSFEAMKDADRVLVGEADRLGNVTQVRELLAGGYTGYLSFEPFAESVHGLADPTRALEQSINLLRQGLA